MTGRFLTSITLAAFVSGLAGAPLLAQQNAPQDSRNPQAGAGLTVPFTTTGTNNGGTVDVAGTFSINRFAAQNGRLFAVGMLAATVRDTVGLRSVMTEVAIPVSAINGGSAPRATGVIQPAASCGILHLELAPLNLDMLGLIVHLDRVALDMSAEASPGSLLGNLLCSVSGLLNSGSLAQNLNQLVGQLNQLVAAL